MNIGIALLTDREVHNNARELTFHMNEKYKTGFESASLPQHISLKQSFPYSGNIDEIAEYTKAFSKSLTPFKVYFEKIEVNHFGEDEKILAWLRIKECKELREIHSRLCAELQEKYGISPIGFDGERWKFHSTLAHTKIANDSADALILEYNNKEIGIEFEAKEMVLFCGVDNSENSSEYFSYKIFEIG